MNFPDTGFPWYCLRAQPKRESLAAQQLPTLEGVTAFLPRVKFSRKTKDGVRTGVEPLFPGYLFASFDFWSNGKQVGYTRGVARIVRRATLDPIVVPESVMAGLFALAPDGFVHADTPEFKVGDEVRVVAGVFAGAETKIVRLLPGVRRVAVLMRLLGHEQEIVLDAGTVDFPPTDPRRRL